MTIIDWIVANHYATNVFQATAIARGCRLADIPGDRAEQERRVVSYRAWRDSRVFNNTASCFAMAIAGERVPELPLEAK